MNKIMRFILDIISIFVRGSEQCMGLNKCFTIFPREAYLKQL